MPTPTHLAHQPITGSGDYHLNDGYFAPNTDAKALSVGYAQWKNSNKDISLKIFRYDNKWSRQSEEMPVHRAIDLVIFYLQSLLHSKGRPVNNARLPFEVINQNGLADIERHFQNHQTVLQSRLEELKNLLNGISPITI